MTALARASDERLVCRFARMYGISDHAAAETAPARGRTHFVIIVTEHSGQSEACEGSKMRSDQ